jgi:signal transduction histidine kinase
VTPTPTASIKRKITAAIMLTAVAVLLITVIAFASYDLARLRKGMIENLSTLGQVVAGNSTAALAFRDENDAASVLSSLKAEPQIVAAALYDRQGKIFVTYPARMADGHFPAVPKPGGHSFEHQRLILFEPVVQNGARLGTLCLEAGLGIFYQRLEIYAGLSVFIIVGSLALALLLSYRLQKRVSEPILSLAETAKAVAVRKDFSVRAAKFADDELGLLTDAFNRMLVEIHHLNATLEHRVQERTAQLEAVNKELEAFSYSVSHDLRAPLRHIDGFVEMLRQTSAASLDSSGQRYLEIISESAKRMGGLIDDLLVFSRMGRSEMRRENVKTSEQVAEVLREMARDLEGRNIHWDIAPLPEVNGDRAMLKQVWVNLLSNAVKYTRHRERAEIEVRCHQNNATDIEFSVRDNGAGFDMQYADKLFGVFQRLHHSEEFEGTGIGLANVRRIIQRHGGKTWAEGKVDAGATFYFTLPKLN